MREEFMITRGGRQYVLFAGLLDEAHSRGLKSIDTELLQVPDESNGHVAVVKATVEMEDGRTFSGLGDASPENVSRNIASHLIRMAETRAKARALRDAVNVGATALEELTDGDDAPPVPARQEERRPRPSRAHLRDATASQRSRENGEHPARDSSQKARPSQVNLLRTLAEELRGENGVARLESRIGKPLTELTRAEADEWIDRLTPPEERG
ncbi:MAG: hypothetical protein K6T51_14135 [Rubrobacteraceae bacterium]|uniref:hypothetical protein n=1 Tax=Rubrobacter naiadicus TaxID=1392641 RepID=UPI00236169FA|nr:hypothetical protein [Rubrobacter naiadicus]MBX6762833.1 hypothetical protein [Rubrobacteraceae bacterium]MCL6439739.1 hypothetical protein [Rubrobacteraceae bacterium]